VILESDRPFAAPHAGERVTIGDLEGFHESRLTMGQVASVSHTFTGSSRKLTHITTVHVVQGP
jgi:microcystin-dependent protein